MYKFRKWFKVSFVPSFKCKLSYLSKIRKSSSDPHNLLLILPIVTLYVNVLKECPKMFFCVSVQVFFKSLQRFYWSTFSLSPSSFTSYFLSTVFLKDFLSDLLLFFCPSHRLSPYFCPSHRLSPQITFFKEGLPKNVKIKVRISRLERKIK